MVYSTSLPCLCLYNQSHSFSSLWQAVPAALQLLAEWPNFASSCGGQWSIRRPSGSCSEQRRHYNVEQLALTYVRTPQMPGSSCHDHLQQQMRNRAYSISSLDRLSGSDKQQMRQPVVQRQKQLCTASANSSRQYHASSTHFQQATANSVCMLGLPTSSWPLQQHPAALLLSNSNSKACGRHSIPPAQHHQLQQHRGFVSSSAAAAVPLQASYEELQKAVQADESQSLLTPAAVVERLDKVIVGQQDAKKAVAIAFRNRWRRQRVADVEMRGEITPKNLLLMGPTGCGKTEIARRLAKLAEAPFIKVEATKFTEVGYHGRDVDSIIRDLVEVAITTVKHRCMKAAAQRISEAIESHILHQLLGEGASHEALAEARDKYRAGELEDAKVEVEVPSPKMPGMDNGGFTIQSGSMSVNFISMMGPGGGLPRGKEKRTMSVGEARPYLEEMEAERQFPTDLIIKEAIRVAEQEGIVFIDEIDKIVNPSGMLRHGSDPSAEGVQRDLLPLIEGSVVSTKHGPVATDHMLFIASGAFTSSKPSDMMAELQGRLPIRVELKGLTAADFEKILTEPECNMIFQQQQLLGCEGVDLVFTPEAIREIAAMAEQINKEVENIGARRLHTVLERLVEDISFEAPDRVAEAKADEHTVSDDYSSGGSSNADNSTQGHGLTYVHVIDKKDVQEKLVDLLKKQDLDKYIL